jgi:predicted phage terminase large subunit-like protein
MMNSPLSPAEPYQPQTAAATLLHRRAIRANLIELAREFGYEPVRHHLKIIERLNALARGDIDRLLICAPPGSAKSTYVSVLFILWFLANNPAANIIHASHTQDRAETWGRKLRNNILEHDQTLGISLRSDSMAVGRWELTSGGSYMAVGCGQAVLGARADLVVIDDPIRSREAAWSEIERKNLWEWYSGDLKTRLRPGGKIVLIMTRWHESDLGGRLLEEMEKGGDLWETLILPPVAEENDPLGRKPGEFLWDGDPNYLYGTQLRRELATQSPMNWAAVFQQRPSPETGAFFDRDWIKHADPPGRETLAVYGGADFAVTSHGGDYTAFVVVGVNKDYQLHVLDVKRIQTTPDDWINVMLDLTKNWEIISWAVEKGQILSSIDPLLQRMSLAKKIYPHLIPFASRHDKATRARAVQGHVAQHSLYLDTKAPWFAAFQQELLSFPAGRHDDMVDALSCFGQLLNQALPGRLKVADVEPDEELKFRDYTHARDREDDWDINRSIKTL